MRLLPLVVLALLAVAPAAASAATVRVDVTCSSPTGKGPESCGGVLTFQALPGETNDVTADPPAGGNVVLHDAGAPLTAGSGCTQVDAMSARCANIVGTVSLGDGSDRLTLATGIPLIANGDAGDDLVSAGTAHGGDGNDVLAGSDLDGGAGSDSLVGTAGDDTLNGGAGDDTIDGGPGADTVAYSGEGPALAVTVDLGDPAPDGAAGERDTLVAIENVTGSGADGDLLRGDEGPNVLRGGGGEDRLLGAGGDDELDGAGRLDGGAGDDTLTGSDEDDVLRGGDGDDHVAGLGGADVIEGGAGDDLLDSSEQAGERTLDVDELRCGSGRDRVSEPDIYDRARSCERIAVGGGLVVDSSTLVRRAGPRVEVVVLCARRGRRCATTVATGGATAVAFTPPLPVRLAPGARRRIVLNRFHPGGRARLRRAKIITFGTKDHGFAVRVGA